MSNGARYRRARTALVDRVVAHPIARRLTRTALARRFTMYALGSVVAFVIGNVVFMAMYVLGASPTACSVGGFISAAIPNWILNRRWAWQREGRPPARQVVGYIGVSIVVLVSTSLATEWTNAAARSLPSHQGLRLAAVTGAYVAVTVVLFVVKFWIYDFWVFSERSRMRAALRSLRQVPSTARANRNP
ncbi:MAG: GtrA family protein [Solirubrobacteraceae bacterium]